MRACCPYKWEYTPGICASSKDCGRGLSHLSGFHSSESNPHNAGFLFDAMMEIIISVPLGTCSSFNSCPFVPLIGEDKGKIMSCRTLIESEVWMVLTNAQVEQHWRSQELGEGGIARDGISSLKCHYSNRLHSQAKRLSANRIQVRKRNQFIVRDIFTATFFSGLSNFMPHFGLNILMLGEEVEYPR